MTTVDKIFDIAFEADGINYKGWANPSDKMNEDDIPSSFHVVLNDVSFGNVSRNIGTWTVNQDRPDKLTKLVGEAIEKHYAVL